MLKIDLVNHLNSTILRDASKLSYIVKDIAPNSENALFSSTSTIIWSGASDNTIFQNKSVNYAFRALHDNLHVSTGLGFKPEHEIELGRIQASKYSGLVADIIYCEVALQAEYFLKHGIFVKNQVEFTVNFLKTKGL